MTINPITPSSALIKNEEMQNEIIEAFNELIIAHFDGFQSIVLYSWLKKRITAKLHTNKKCQYYNEKNFPNTELLNYYSKYDMYGWHAENIQPTYGPYKFVFTKRS